MRVLLIEDNPGDALLVRAYLEELDASLELDHVMRLSEAAPALQSVQYDALLVDLSLPDAQGLETVRKTQALAPHTPIVVMTGLGDEATALAAVQAGAQDYLVKGQASGGAILRALRYAAERGRLKTELEVSRERAELLSALGEALQGARSPQDVFSLTSSRIGSALKADGMSLWHSPSEQLEPRWSWGHGTDHPDEATKAYLQQALVANQSWRDPPGQNMSRVVEPVLDGAGKAVAALLVTRGGQGDWLERELDLLRRAAATLGLALERADMIARLETSNANLEAKTALALEAAQLVAWDWEIGKDRLTLSGNAAEVLGTGAGQAYYSKAGLAFVHPDDLEGHRATVNHAIQHGEPYRDTLRLWHTERHEYLWIEEYGVVRTDASGQATGVSGVTQDINDRQRAEEQLQESQQRLELALESAGVGVWDWNLESSQVNWYGHNDRIFGFPRGTTQISFPDIMARVHEEDRAHLEAALNQTLEGDDLDVEYRTVWEDGTVLNALSRGRVVRDTRGNNVRMSGTTVDLTQIKRAETTLRRVNEAQKRFVGDAAHELRAPLTSIQGNLALLRRYTDMPTQERSASIEDAHREASRLGRLVTDLLELARGDSGQDLRREPIHLDQLLGEAARQAQYLAKNHHLEIGELTPCVVEGDRDRLKQLCLILLENALKYTPKGGTVRLDLTCDPDWSTCTITDSGIGIADEDLPHVFDRFYRADKGRARGNDPGGTGLGLPIAQWIVAQHGGQIHLESELGRGTKAVVRLPIAP